MICYNDSVMPVRGMWERRVIMKKIMAFAAALMMVVSTASCGSNNNDDSKKAEETTGAATTTVQADATEEESSEAEEESSAADEEESKAADSSEAEETPSADGEYTASEKNVFIFYNAPDYEPTLEELTPIINKVSEHYEAARAEDWKAYLETENYGGLINAGSFRALADYSEDEVNEMPSGINMAVNYLYYGLVCNYAEEKYGEEYKDSTIAEYIDSVTKAWDEITDEEAQPMVEGGFGLYRELHTYDEFLQQVEWDFFENRDNYKISGDAVFNVFVEDCDKIGDDLYMNLNIKVFTGDTMIAIPQLCCWSADGEIGVMSQVVRFYGSPYPGKTTEEIMTALENGDPGIDPDAESEAESTESEAAEGETEE